MGKCYICNQATNGYICKEHTKLLKKLFEDKVDVISTPEWKHHCVICGEHEERLIIDYEGVLLCNICIDDEIQKVD